MWPFKSKKKDSILPDYSINKLFAQIEKEMDKYEIIIETFNDGRVQFYYTHNGSGYVWGEDEPEKRRVKGQSCRWTDKNEMLEDLRQTIIKALKGQFSEVKLSSVAAKENIDYILGNIECQDRCKMIEGYVRELCCSKLGADAFKEASSE